MVVSLGDFETLEPEHPTLYAFTRSLGDEMLVVVGDDGEATDVAGALRPWEVRVVRRG